MNRLHKITVSLAAALCILPATGEIKIENPRCEYTVCPLSVSTLSPRFSWELSGGGSLDGNPTVEIATDSLFRHAMKVKATSLHSALDGKKLKLKPQTRYYWRVSATEGKKSVMSPTTWFETTKLPGATWQAQWISDGLSKNEPVAPVFKKEFTLASTPKQGRAYISAVGYYDLYINGKRVGDHHMDPGYTDYTKRSLYVTHDVTPLLHSGKNEIMVTLGNGFSNVMSKDAWNQENAPWRDRPQLIMELTADGKTVAATDASWLTALSPTVYNNIYSGEHVDARLVPSDWKNATVVAPRSGALTSQQCPPIRPVEKIKADLLHSFGDTIFIYNIGKNIAGVCNIKLRGAEGTKVKVRHGEILRSNGLLERDNINIYYHPVRDDEEFQTEVYVLSGNPEGDSFAPRFTYHGFQYVEIASDAPVKVDEVEANFMRTDVSRAGHFSCSNPLLNKIYDATMLSYEDNIHSIPTDCPQREKNGWTADAHVAVQLGLLNYDGITFYEKWMRDIKDSQKPNGNIPGIIPSPGWGYGEWPGPVWDAVLFIIPNALYDFYGDMSAIREIYPTMKQYFNWIKPLKKENGTLTNGIGDWLSASSQTPTDFTSTLYYYVDNKIMARMACLMGDDPKPYIDEMNSTRNIINDLYYNKSTGLYAGGTQAAQAIALYWDVVSEDQQARVAANLNKMIIDNGYALDFGLLGSKSALRMLTKYGYGETAYKMATRTDAPSWGYWLEKNGQTTLGETWVMNPKFRDASLNHVFFGDIAAWMTNDIAGLNFDSSKPGFENVVVNPTFLKDLDWAKADYHSVKGPVSVQWQRNGNRVTLTVDTPAGVTATLFPGTSRQKIVTGHTSLDITE